VGPTKTAEIVDFGSNSCQKSSSRCCKEESIFKYTIGFNEEIKNSDFSGPLLPMGLTKTALIVFSKHDKRSECGSVLSAVTNRSANGMFKKHCGPCEFKLIVNWSQHKNDVNKGV